MYEDSKRREMRLALAPQVPLERVAQQPVSRLKVEGLISIRRRQWRKRQAGLWAHYGRLRRERKLMNVYVVISQSRPLEQLIDSNFEESDRCKLRDGVWMVRSSRLTSSEIVEDLRIKPDLSGIVIKAANYDGRAPREIVQKLSAWED